MVKQHRSENILEPFIIFIISTVKWVSEWVSVWVSGEVWNSSREEHAVLRGSADMQATIRQKMTADI